MYEERRVINANENGPINSLEKPGKTKTATVSLNFRRIEIQTQYTSFTKTDVLSSQRRRSFNHQYYSSE